MSVEGGTETIQAELVAIERGEQRKTQEAIAEAERRAELLAKVTIAAVKRTYPQDWIDFRSQDPDDKGTPYLAAAGAERLRSLFGISITDLDVKRYEDRDKDGAYYFYVVTAIAHWRGDEVAVMGTCSSRDQFYRTRYQDGQRVLLPSEEIDPTNIVKAARSNMIANAVSGILGLRGLTWTQLAQFGVERGKGGTATFGDRKPRPEASATPAAAPKVDQLEARLRELSGGDEAAIGTMLLGVTVYQAYTRKKDNKQVPGFGGFKSIADLRAKARDPQKVAAIALRFLEQAVKEGRIAETKSPEPREGDHPGVEGEQQPLAAMSIADEHAQPPEDLPDGD